MDGRAFDWLSKRATLSPTRTAIVDTGTGAELSYERFDERASRFAEFLTDHMEIEPGARVAILSENGAHYFEVIYGCAKAETLYVALNWRLTPSELEYVVDDADPDVLVYGEEFAEAVDTLRPSIDVDHYVAVGEPTDADDWTYEEGLSAASGASVVMARRDRSETMGLLYTSGTTGRPKGVRQTFDMVVYNYLNIGLKIDLTAEDTTLNVLPCFHTGGLNLYANPTFVAGGTAIVQPRFDPTEALELLEQRATAFFGVPANYNALRQEPGFDDADLSSVRSWGVGGAPMPVDLFETYAERDVVVRQGMGMTETGPTVFLIEEERAVEKPDSVGKPAPFVDVRIVDRGGNEAPAGESGELQIGGPGVTPGYWENPEANEEAFVVERTNEGGSETAMDTETGARARTETGTGARAGAESDSGSGTRKKNRRSPGRWLRTGDVARRDEDGDYYIVDRLTNMYISGGENVYPAEVERVLHDHPAIAEAAVVPTPDEEWGEVGTAFVVPETGETITDEAVRTHCRGALAAYKIPAFVERRDELPRNAAGKIDREKLTAETVE